MPNQDKSLKRKEAFRQAFSEALGLNLADEVAESLLNSEPLSLEQLSKNHTLTEIGIALVRLDALYEGSEEGPGLCCIPTPWGKLCFPCPNIPPDED